MHSINCYIVSMLDHDQFSGPVARYGVLHIIRTTLVR